MTGGTAKDKDAWDKLDVATRVLSAGLIGLIALLVKTGSDRISLTLEEAGLVQSLIADLSTREERTRRDVALIALDHYMTEPEDSPLVAQIAERLFLDVSSADSLPADQQALASKAFEVLERRDPERAATLRAQVLAALAEPTTRTQARSTADTSRVATYRSRPALLATLVRSNVVYVQYGGSATALSMETLRERLQAAGFTVPGTERVETAFSSSVRYFHVEDRATADSVATVTRQTLEGLGEPSQLVVQSLVVRGASVPRGQVEVWISRR